MPTPIETLERTARNQIPSSREWEASELNEAYGRLIANGAGTTRSRRQTESYRPARTIAQSVADGISDSIGQRITVSETRAEAPPPSRPPRTATPGHRDELALSQERGRQYILDERRRQTQRGIDRNDAQWTNGELKQAAAAYEYNRPDLWPTNWEVRNISREGMFARIVKAGALWNAEVDRLCEVLPRGDAWKEAMDDAIGECDRLARKLGEMSSVKVFDSQRAEEWAGESTTSNPVSADTRDGFCRTEVTAGTAEVVHDPIGVGASAAVSYY